MSVITCVPKAPTYMRGVANVRGSASPTLASSRLTSQMVRRALAMNLPPICGSDV